MNKPFENTEPDLRRQIEDLQQEVTDLKKALLESVNKFRALTDSAPVGIFLDDAHGRAIYINKKCAELVGVPAEKALEFDWIPYLHPEDRDRMVAEWKKSFKNGSEFRMEYRWLHSNGEVVWTQGEVIPLLDDDNKAALFIGTLTDITPQKEAQIEKENLQAQLVQAQKMEVVGRLAGGVAHDFNNMISVIMGNAELAMIELDEASSVHENLKEISKAATRSAEITRKLLTFARKQIVSPDVFDMNESVRDMIKMIERLIGEDIHLVWAPQTGRIPIKMDSSQFDRIVVNLCVNARDAIDGVGEITIETKTVILDEAFCVQHIGSYPGEFAVLSVRDNGSGIDEAIQEHIFEPFFTTKAENAGTGLGLASVYGAVKQTNGFIDIQSELGAGSNFKIYFPQHTGPMSGHSALDPKTAQKGSGETVLVVEDEGAILFIVKSILKGFGYKVMATDSPSEALNLAHNCNEEIDLLITDVIMPKMNGRDLANRLLSDRPNMKCLYMSGYTADVIANQGVLEKNINFIQKPFRTQELISKVQEILNRKC